MMTAPSHADHPHGPMVDVRCRNCGRLLLRIDAERARVEVVCPDNRCKRYQQHRITEVSPKSMD